MAKQVFETFPSGLALARPVGVQIGVELLVLFLAHHGTLHSEAHLRLSVSDVKVLVV